jgi:hypothetical protein
MATTLCVKRDCRVTASYPIAGRFKAASALTFKLRDHSRMFGARKYDVNAFNFTAPSHKTKWEDVPDRMGHICPKLAALVVVQAMVHKAPVVKAASLALLYLLFDDVFMVTGSRVEFPLSLHKWTEIHAPHWVSIQTRVDRSVFTLKNFRFTTSTRADAVVATACFDLHVNATALGHHDYWHRMGYSSRIPVTFVLQALGLSRVDASAETLSTGPETPTRQQAWKNLPITRSPARTSDALAAFMGERELCPAPVDMYVGPAGVCDRMASRTTCAITRDSEQNASGGSGGSGGSGKSASASKRASGGGNACAHLFLQPETQSLFAEGLAKRTTFRGGVLLNSDPAQVRAAIAQLAAEPSKQYQRGMCRATLVVCPTHAVPAWLAALGAAAQRPVRGRPVELGDALGDALALQTALPAVVVVASRNQISSLAKKPRNYEARFNAQVLPLARVPWVRVVVDGLGGFVGKKPPLWAQVCQHLAMAREPAPEPNNGGCRLHKTCASAKDCRTNSTAKSSKTRATANQDLKFKMRAPEAIAPETGAGIGGTSDAGVAAAAVLVSPTLEQETVQCSPCFSTSGQWRQKALWALVTGTQTQLPGKLRAAAELLNAPLQARTGNSFANALHRCRALDADASGGGRLVAKICATTRAEAADRPAVSMVACVLHDRRAYITQAALVCGSKHAFRTGLQYEKQTRRLLHWLRGCSGLLGPVVIERQDALEEKFLEDCGVCLDPAAPGQIIAFRGACDHWLCAACVESHFNATSDAGGNIACPFCRQSVAVPKQCTRVATPSWSFHPGQVSDKLQKAAGLAAASKRAGASCAVFVYQHATTLQALLATFPDAWHLSGPKKAKKRRRGGDPKNPPPPFHTAVVPFSKLTQVAGDIDAAADVVLCEPCAATCADCPVEWVDVLRCRQVRILFTAQTVEEAVVRRGWASVNWLDFKSVQASVVDLT